MAMFGYAIRSRTAMKHLLAILRQYAEVAVHLIILGVGTSLAHVASIASDEAFRIQQLTSTWYVVTTWKPVNGTPFPANFMYGVTDAGIVLIDAPWDTTATRSCLDTIQRRHQRNVVACVVTHAHDDRTASIPMLRSIGIATWSSRFTDSLCIERGEAHCQYHFNTDTTIVFGSTPINIKYLGKGHSDDNVVVWLPKDRILFGGCLIKSTENVSLGNLEHANVGEWRSTAQRLVDSFRIADHVVPGHFAWGGRELLDHTLALTKAWLNDNLIVYGYFRGGLQEAKMQSTDGLTDVAFSFIYLRDGQAVFESDEQEGVLRELLQKRSAHPGLRVHVSVGGWGGCETCSDVFSTEAGRRRFVTSLQQLIQKYDLDGVDIDWETPVIGGFKNHPAQPADRDNLTELLRLMRKQFDERVMITIAANSDSVAMEKSYDWAAILPLVDVVSLMTYGLPNDRRGHTGHHTALYSSEYQRESIDRAIARLRAKGLPLRKFLLGAGFYAFVVRNVEAGSTHGLGMRGSFLRNCTYDELTRDYTKAQGFETYRDSVARAPYRHNRADSIFITFDDPESLFEKSRYILKNGLGGCTIWKINGDDAAGSLRRAIKRGLTDD